MSGSQPIFVLGPPRCGTTLVANILGRHSRIFMPGETHFFEDVYSRNGSVSEPFDGEARRATVQRLSTLYGRYNEASHQERIDRLLQRESVQRRLGNIRTYRDALSAFMEVQAEDEGKERWGNQTPRDIFNLDAILDFYPHAAFVVCIRDVRDFLNSYKYKWRATSEAEAARIRALYHPVITSLLWRSSVRRIERLAQRVPARNRVVVRYEDMVDEPERTVRRICDTLREDYQPAMLDVHTYASSHGTRQSGIFATSVGRWRTELRPEEVATAQRLTGAEMKTFGYAPEPQAVNRLRCAGLYLSAPTALSRALWVNRYKRGPLVPYLSRRLGLSG